MAENDALAVEEIDTDGVAVAVLVLEADADRVMEAVGLS